DANLGVDVDEAVALAGRGECDGREVGLRAQRGGELHAAAAVGEVEVGRQLQVVTVANDLIALVSDRFLHVVQTQRPALDGITVRLKPDTTSTRCGRVRRVRL